MNIVKELYAAINNANAWEGEIDLNRGQILSREGEINTKLYWVENGCLKIFIHDEEMEHIIRFAYHQNFMSLIDSYFTENTTALNVNAIRKTKVKWISKTGINSLLYQNNKLQSLWKIVSESLIVQQLEREIDLLTSSPKKRYERVFKRSPQLLQEVPLKYIASYLRMTPETLSRIQKS